MKEKIMRLKGAIQLAWYFVFVFSDSLGQISTHCPLPYAYVNEGILSPTFFFLIYLCISSFAS